MSISPRKPRRNARVRPTRRTSSFRLETLEDRTLLTAGMLDPGFGVGGLVTTDFGGIMEPSSDAAYSMVQADGKTLLAGTSNPGATGNDFAVARYNLDGSLDSAFGTGGLVTIDFGFSYDDCRALSMQGDKIVLAGYSVSSIDYRSAADFAVVRLNADGTLDDTFDGDGKQTIGFEGYPVFGQWGEEVASAVAVQGDKIVLVGSRYPINDNGDFIGDSDSALARLNYDGTLDNSFGVGGKLIVDLGMEDYLSSVAMQADGKIVVAGSSQQGGTDRDFAVARFNADGTLDNAFGVGGTTTIDFLSTFEGAGSLAFQGDRIVVAGASRQSATGFDFAVARLNADGTLDDTFGVDGKLTIDFGSDDYGQGVAVQADGKIVVAGFSDQGATGFDFALVRLLGTSNPALTITALGSQEYTQTELTVQVAATGPNAGDTLTYSVSFVSREGAGAVNDPTGFSLDSSGLFHWTPGGGQLGQYTFLVTVSDGQGASAEATFVVTTLGVVDGVLIIVGSDGSDRIVIKPTDCDLDELTVRINERDYGFKLKPKHNPANPYTDVTLIHVHGLGGDDDITVKPAITIPAWLYGGLGDDKLKGGDGDDVLLGGDGDDLIVGGDGRDLLIGGRGADKIVGNAGDDLIISGYTAFDAIDSALAAIMAEWTSCRTYADRVKNLRGDVSNPTFAARANGDIHLAVDGSHGRAVTVFDDGVKDVLTGDDGLDWFLFNADGDNQAKKDKVTDLNADEFADDLDFINN